MEEAATLKERGTNFFKAGKWQSALETYEHGGYYISDCFFGDEFLKDASAEESIPTRAESLPSRDNPPPPPTFAEGSDAKKQAEALLISCLLNATQCCLKLEDWRGAEARRGSGADKRSVKAPSARRGAHQAGRLRRRPGRPQEGMRADPKSKEVREAFDECRKAEAEAGRRPSRCTRARGLTVAARGAAAGRGGPVSCTEPHLSRCVEATHTQRRAHRQRYTARTHT